MCPAGAPAVPCVEAAALVVDEVAGDPAGCFAEASAVPFAEAAALVVDQVEGSPLGPLRLANRGPLKGILWGGLGLYSLRPPAREAGGSRHTKRCACAGSKCRCLAQAGQQTRTPSLDGYRPSGRVRVCVFRVLKRSRALVCACPLRQPGQANTPEPRACVARCPPQPPGLFSFRVRV